jgi:hypothetical protein
MAHEPEVYRSAAPRGWPDPLPYDDRVTDPRDPRPQPGERPPQTPNSGGRLERPPSDRYRTAAQPAGAPVGTSSAGPAIALAGVVAVIGALILTVMLGVILVTTGTFVVSLLGGGLIGLIVAGPTVGGGRSPAMSRGAASRLAIGLALGMVVLAGLATWVLGRTEGGVMDPVTYLWTVFGFGIPAQALLAVLAAAWGAANGPIRWRQ